MDLSATRHYLLTYTRPCRPPNVMVLKSEGDTWAVQLVDLDWAGVVGRAVYPPLMSDSIDWHHSAGPGQPLQIEHDLHFLHTLFRP